MPKLLDPTIAQVKPAKREEQDVTCNFCKGDRHQYCPRAVANTARPRKIWPCGCREESCGGGSVLRCLECKTETPGDVNPTTWSCLDPVACETRVQKRLDANPAYRTAIEYKERNIMAKATVLGGAAKAAAAKKAAAPKTPKAQTFCLVTGEATSGGLFKPGMDARYVATLVNEVVVDKSKTITEARKQLKEDGVSPALTAKFEKAVILRRESLAKAKTEPTKAPAKKTVAKRTAAKKAVAPVEPDEDDETDEDDEDGF